MSQKLNIKDITNFPIKTSVLVNTPSTDDTTIYVAYGNPTKEGNLNEVVIQRTIILANDPGAGDTDITDAWAVTSLDKNDQLEFNKKWNNRAAYDYKNLSY